MAGEPNIVYPILTVVGIVAMGYTLFKFGVEQFDVPRWRSPNDGRSAASVTRNSVSGFLASDVVVFGAVIGAFIFMRLHTGWSDWTTVPFASWPGLLNTYVLLTSSFTVILALVFAERQSKKGLLGAMGATLLLALTFMGVKAYEYGVKFQQGEFWWTGIEYSIYFVTTGLHALHVIFGVLIALFMIYRIVSVDAYLEDHRPVEFFGLYWHFVDIVWVILFPLFYLM